MTRQAGFTLVEMLVALSVFAILTAAGVGVLNQGFAAKQQAQAIEDRLNRVQAALALLRADLAQAEIRPSLDPRTGRTHPGFEGGTRFRDEPVLSLVRRGWPNPGGRVPRGSLQYVEYFIRDGVLVRQARAQLDAWPETPVYEQPLLDGLGDVQLQFQDGPRFFDQWISTSGAARLPQTVRLLWTVDGLGALEHHFLIRRGTQ